MLHINARSWQDRVTAIWLVALGEVPDLLGWIGKSPVVIWATGILCATARSAVDRQTQYDAEEPRPAPIGIDVFNSTEKEPSLFMVKGML